jgi:hypothetical protein
MSLEKATAIANGMSAGRYVGDIYAGVVHDRSLA